MKTFEYGAMSSKYSLEAENKLIAYATMVLHFCSQPQIVALYEPQEIVKDDSWLFAKDVEKRMDQIFGGKEKAFLSYMENHKEEIKQCYQTIKQLV